MLSQLNHVYSRCMYVSYRFARWQLFFMFAKNKRDKHEIQINMKTESAKFCSASGKEMAQKRYGYHESTFICSSFFFLSCLNIIEKIEHPKTETTTRLTSCCTRERHILACQRKTKKTTQTLALNVNIWHCAVGQSYATLDAHFVFAPKGKWKKENNSKNPHLIIME